MSGRTVLIVDGDPESRNETVSHVSSSGLQVLDCGSAKDALRLAREAHLDVVLTEAFVSDVTGAGLLRLLREEGFGEARVVLLSPWATEVDRVIAFEAGFDDFVARPYSPSELAARVRALLRRSSRGEPRPAARPGGELPAPALEPGAEPGLTALRWQRPPTPKELRLLEELVQRGGRVMSRLELLEAVWGQETRRTERVVDAHIKAIRGKLGPDRHCVETVRGVGYRFRERRTGTAG